MEKYRKKLENICLDKNKFKKLESTYFKFGDKLWNTSEYLEKNLNITSFKNFINAYRNLATGLVITTHIGRHMHTLLINSLQKYYPKISKQELDILIGNITYPNKNTPLIESQLLLLEIGEELQKKKLNINKIKNNPKIYKIFKNYIKKYSFIPVNFNEESWTEKQILEQLKNLMKNNCSKERKNILRQHKEKVKLSQELLRKIRNNKIKEIANSLKKGTFLNEYRKYIFCRASLAYRLLFKKIAELYNLSDWRECWKFSPDEIIRLYFNDEKKLIKVLKERKLAGVIFANNKNGYRIFNKKELNFFLKDINKKSYKTKESRNYQVRGTIANCGIIKGIVSVISGKDDFNKFKDNNVIVTAMTSVDFVPIMKRASAFVTDEGGITSHASIVSREMNKPCIIGTKIATQVLKDGDLVEVDANNGVVKILKRAK